MEGTIAEKLKNMYWPNELISDLRDMLYKSAEKFKDKTAFLLKDKNGRKYNISYEKFKEDVEAIGTILIEKGLTGQKIAIIGKNSYNWAVSYLAISTIGVVVPIDKELHYDDYIKFLNIAKCSAVVGDGILINGLLEHENEINNDSMLYIKMDDEKSSEKIIDFNSIIKNGRSLVENGNTSFKDIKIDPNELHVLLFTSGTTGNAKGVCLSHKNITSNILSTCGIVKITPKDRILSILPIHHTYECNVGFLTAIYKGATIFFCEGLKHITNNMKEFKPTVILCVPLLLENINKKIRKTVVSVSQKFNIKMKDYSIDRLPRIFRVIVRRGVKKSLGGKMRAFMVGAASLNTSIIASFRNMKMKVLQGYGLTECSPLVAGNTDFFSKDDAVGLPIPNVEYKIVNPDEKGIGEIVVKGDNVMLGYYKNEEETAKVLKNGWFYTGDLGRVDEQGYLYITGRSKTVIITKNGKNIYPEEIEEYFVASPLVEEVLVMGINHENDDETYIHVQIFPSIEGFEEKFGKTEFSKEEIKKEIEKLVSEVNKKLPNYKRIKKLHIRENEFEKTTTKKIKRFGDNLQIVI